MRIAGVVVEYNPLHNGHLYHLQETRKKINPDLLFAVMSGNFLQRGEPAILSKWKRTELALKAGIDLVIELPYFYATQKAEVFAWGAVSLLEDLGVTDLCFGSEDGRIEPFHRTLEALTLHRSAYQNNIRNHIKEGNSYPKAQSLAFKSLKLDPKESVDLSKPNNILGYHYVQAAEKLGGNLKVHTIGRTGAGYHDSDLNRGAISSATAIRQHLFEHDCVWDDMEQYVPSYTAEALKEAADHHELRSWQDYFPYLNYRLLTDSVDHLQSIYEMEEGLENRLKKEIRYAASFSELMSSIKTKRYTWTRLQRLLTHVLTQATKVEMTDALTLERPDYIRLLGMSKKGQFYLNQQKEDFRIPVISRLGKEAITRLSRDLQAADCYQLVPTREKNEFQQTPIRL